MTNHTTQSDFVRKMYDAYAAGDRAFYEKYLSKDVVFSSPVDPQLDYSGYFERCWPGAGKNQKFSIVRFIENNNETVVTYEVTFSGKRGRNTEIITILGDKIVRIEVYFGWDLQLLPGLRSVEVGEVL